MLKFLPILIGLLLLNCSREEIISKKDSINEIEYNEITINDTVSCQPADTTPILYPIEFTVEVKDWENVN